MKKFTILIALMLVLVLAVGCGQGGQEQSAPDKEPKDDGTQNAATLLDNIKERGTIKVGTEGTYPPFTFMDESGNITGYDVEVITEVAKRIGVEAEFVPTEWKAVFAGLDSKRFDLIANQVGINEDRKKKYDFSEPYTVSGAQLIVHKDTDDISSVEDLAGKKVGASQGSNYAEIAEEAGGEMAFYPGANEYLADLAAKRVDAALNDRLFVMEYIMNHPNQNLKVAGEPFNRSEMAFTFRKGSEELVDAVNLALEEMRADGTLAEISQKWFGEDVSK
ncbi:transporter substrate-binding domain-containing protein [Metallumcola ferriviriculae]|uniref:Transporter substrate-binding domain-containing protein n=1 Tax=Metallumcola ferriviriculae TaxID=3039180 RepID=A0AAU0UJX2_9FIRM|nr:transporter substrate-binding domain-containing protein [Desulfitibacteraceae bacterium MK1]